MCQRDGVTGTPLLSGQGNQKDCFSRVQMLGKRSWSGRKFLGAGGCSCPIGEFGFGGGEVRVSTPAALAPMRKANLSVSKETFTGSSCPCQGRLPVPFCHTAGECTALGWSSGLNCDFTWYEAPYFWPMGFLQLFCIGGTV